MWLLLAIVCLKPFASDRVKLPSVDQGPLTGEQIACVYISQKKKINCLLPEGLVAYQRPSRLLEREYVTLSSVSVDKKNACFRFRMEAFSK